MLLQHLELITNLQVCSIPEKVWDRLQEPFQLGANALPWVPALHMNAADTR